MKKYTGILFCAILALSLAACKTAMNKAEKKEVEVVKEENVLEPGKYAVLKIKHGQQDMGQVVVKLFPEKTPITVDNFVGLSEGTREFMNLRNGEKMKKPFYNGLTFHRVISGFMIQAGCPLGTGTGGPGYKFKDEIVTDLKFDKPGLLAMANAGPGTNGSQFFITVAATPWLNGRHTIFGEVVEGMDVINKIAEVPTAAADKPVTPVVMETVTIKTVE
jgi:peptidyl-prolyl cis-trans isomerase A (cyclophilin A)